MDKKLMYIPNDDKKITPFVDNSFQLKLLNTQFNETANQNSIKVPKIVKPTNKKTFL